MSSDPGPHMGTGRESTVVIGRESTGKSSLVAALAGTRPRVANFKGSTVECRQYLCADGRRLIDTPGLLYRSDTATTRLTLSQLEGEDPVLAVVQATNMAEDLAELLCLVDNRRGAVVVTFWDKTQHNGPQAEEDVRRLRSTLGVPVVTVDARRLGDLDREALTAALDAPGIFKRPLVMPSIRWRVQPRRTVFEWPRTGPAVALFFLVLPTIAAVWGANALAGVLDPLVSSGVEATLERIWRWPAPLPDLLGGRYGLVSMGPLLLVWALPTVVIHALLSGAYMASGLLDRLTASVHPLLRRVGLSGRDLVRVLMGFGCNVPAVISSRACSSCTRETCVSGIAFGAACSYQLGATVAVFAAAGRPGLVLPFLAYLGLTTAVYIRLVSDAEARRSGAFLLRDRLPFLGWPRPDAIWREASTTITQFLRKALPIFVVIATAASLLEMTGVLTVFASVIGPAMAVVNLPAEAALPTILASIRKDGILLLAEPDTVAVLSGLQLLTATYLAGVLLPCLVTALTIMREMGRAVAVRIVLRQAAFALLCAAVLAYTPRLVRYS